MIEDCEDSGLKAWQYGGSGGLGGESVPFVSTELCDTNQENLPEVENLRSSHKMSGRS